MIHLAADGIGKERARALREVMDPDGLASSLYERATVASGPSNEAEAIVLAHLVREVIDRCLFCLGAPMPSGAALQKLGELRGRIDAMHQLVGGIPPDESAAKDAFAEIVRQVKDLKSTSDGDPQKGQERFATFFERAEGNETSHAIPYNTGMAARRLQEVRDIAAGASHTDRQMPPDDRIARAVDAWKGLNDAVDGIRSEFTPKAGQLEEIASSAREGSLPSNETLAKLAFIMADPDAEWRFFNKLETPEWVAPLAKAGLFDKAPSAIERPDGSRVLPQWAASKYLARMAPHAPSEVAEAFLEMEMSNNANVARDFRKAVVGLPGDEIRRVIDLIHETNNFSGEIFLSSQVPEIIKRMVADGLLKEAMELVRDVLSVTSEKSKFFNTREEKSKYGISSWGCEKILETVEEEFRGEKALVAFRALRRVVLDSLYQLYPEAKETKRDPSAIKCPNLEAHRKSYGSNYCAVLRTFARISVTAASLGTSELNHVRSELMRVPWSSMKRVCFRVCLEYLDDVGMVDDCAELVALPEHFSDWTARPEYNKLVRALGPRMVSEQTQRYVGMVFSEISEDPIRVRMTKREGKGPKAEEVTNMVEKLRLERLAPISGYLPEETKKIYDEWVERHGNPRDVDEVVSSGKAGFISRGDPGAFMDLTPDEIVGRLEDEMEEVPEGLRALDPEEFGLGTSLAGAIKGRAKELVNPEFAARIPARHSTWYVRGMSDSVKDGHVADMGLALRCVASLTPKADIEWKMGILRLLEAFLEKRDEVTLVGPDEVWSMIAPFLVEKDPNPGGPPKAFDDALNRPSGRAADLAIQILVAIHNGKLSNEKGIGELVKSTLRNLVESGVNVLVHSSCGLRFPQLWAVDKEWARGALPFIFHSKSEAARMAAWRSYVTFNPLYTNIGAALSQLYEEAMMEDFSSGDRYDSEYSEHLGNHLVNLWSSGIGAEEFRDRIPSASRDAVQAMLAIAARMKANIEKSPGGPIEDKLWGLWDRIRARVDAGELKKEDVVDILYWASEPQFERGRRLNIVQWLIGDVKIEGRRFPHNLLETLIADLLEDHERTAAALRRTVHGLPIWEIAHKNEEIFDALERTVHCTPACASELAQIADYMNRHGYDQFSTLYERFMERVDSGRSS